MKYKAYAKINLFLEVLDQRPDGYHNLDTVFQSIDLCDELFFEKQTGGIHLTVSDPSIPAGGKNLVSRVFSLLLEKYPRKVAGARVHIEKRIPVGAGLGGGSADAAAAILAFDRLFELGLEREERNRLALEIGMDVPFCLTGGTMLASSRGEVLKHIQRNTDFKVLVVFPGFSISTREAYKALAPWKERSRRNSEKICQILRGKDNAPLWPELYNAFEQALFPRYPALEMAALDLREEGCDAVVMTGSGAAVCGYVPPGRDLEEEVSRLKKSDRIVAVTRPVNTGVVKISNAE